MSYIMRTYMPDNGVPVVTITGEDMSATDRKIEFYMERGSRKWALQAGLLRIARNNKKKTQHEVAALCFVKDQQYSAWERGTSPVPVRHLRYVCAALEIDQEALAKTMARDYQNAVLRNAMVII